MSLSASSPTDNGQASPYLVGQKSFPFVLGESESQSMMKDIPSYKGHGCDAGTVVATVDD